MSGGPGSTTFADGLLRQLAELTPLLAGSFRDPWWVIGSSAAFLSGDDAAQPRDIDILCSARDADAFADAHASLVDGVHLPADGTRFHSRFVRLKTVPFAVELMGGLEVHRDGRWLPATVARTRTVGCGGADVPLPSLPELIGLFELFGRDKDLARAAALKRMPAREESTHAG